MTTAIYCRISKDDEGEAEGVKRQEDDCRQLVKSRRWKLLDVYVDNDRSATYGGSRPEWDRMLADIDRGKVKRVVAYHNDRLTRRPLELETLLELCDSHNVEIECVTGEARDIFTMRILVAVAAQESANMSRRIRRKKEEDAKLGKRNASRRPYGYDDDGEVIPEEAGRILEAVEYILGGGTVHQLVARWNEEGVTTTRGATWQSTTVKRMLTNPRLAGFSVHKGKVVGEGEWEPILDKGAWAKINSYWGQPRSERSAPAERRILSGIPKCGRCGHGLTVSRGARNGVTYRCRSEAGFRGCGKLSIMASNIEGIVTQHLIDHLCDADQDHDSFETREADAIQAEIDKLEQLREDAVEMFTAGEIDRSQFSTMNVRADERLAPLRQELESIQRGLAREEAQDVMRRIATADDPVSEFQGLDVALQRGVAQELIDVVVVEPVGKSAGGSPNPDRIKITFK